jgi:Na+-transporting NADH:ubiquinone oxidoreductase subunit C
VHSSSYIIRFVLIMTTVSALVLASLNTFLAEKHASNEMLYNRRAILASVEPYIDGGKRVAQLSDDEVNQIFGQQIKQYVLDMNGGRIDGKQAEEVDMARERKKPEADRLLPMYVFTNGEGTSLYILSVRGNGLWDEIWGNIALKDDLVTIAGASFDHTGETPGLGAEIKDNPRFSAQFAGKRIFNEQGEYTSVLVRKGGARDPYHEVDGISGATVTADGVSEMLKRGLRYYQPYFASKTESNELTQ